MSAWANSAQLIPILLVAGTIAGVVAWGIVSINLGALHIPKAEIDRLADEFFRRHPDDPALAAFHEEWNAWHRCEDGEQAKWRRVRREIRRRQLKGVI